MHSHEAGPACLFVSKVYSNLRKLERFLDLYSIDLNDQGKRTTAFSHTHKKTHEKFESILLTQLHFKLPAKVSHGVMLSGLAQPGR